MTFSLTASRLLTGYAGILMPAVFMLFSAEVRAQSPSQTNRAFVPSARVLAMGDAGVALPDKETVFFYNPAHLSRVAGPRPRFTLAGFRGALSSNLFDQLSFFENELQPTLADGIDSTNTGEMRGLYDEALALGRRRTTLNGDLLLPSVIMQFGHIGVGAGVFGHTALNYHFEDAGGGIPLLNFSAMGDVLFVGSGAIDLGRYGIEGLAAGLTGKSTKRWLTMKSKPIDAFGENEHLLLFTASAIGFDLGLLYDVESALLPGELALGFAAYDVIRSGFDYRYDRNMISTSDPNTSTIADEEDAVNALYGVSSSYRIGAAYILPKMPVDMGFTMDYLWYGSPRTSQTAPAHLHLGAQAQFGPGRIRAGLNSGYTTVGAGLDFGIMALDYAFYGIEQGRFPGQLPSWNHSAQVAIRI